MLAYLAYTRFAELRLVLMAVKDKVKAELLKFALEHPSITYDRDIEINVAMLTRQHIFRKRMKVMMHDSDAH